MPSRSQSSRSDSEGAGLSASHIAATLSYPRDDSEGWRGALELLDEVEQRNSTVTAETLLDWDDGSGDWEGGGGGEGERKKHLEALNSFCVLAVISNARDDLLACESMDEIMDVSPHVYCTVLYRTVLYCAVLCCVCPQFMLRACDDLLACEYIGEIVDMSQHVLYCTVLSCTIQHSGLAANLFAFCAPKARRRSVCAPGVCLRRYSMTTLRTSMLRSF